MTRGRRAILALGVALGTALAVVGRATRHGPHTVASRVATLGSAVDARMSPRCAAAGVPYPPVALALLAFKRERVLELWAPDSSRIPRRIHVYSVLGASGGPGPKLREGDLQVPEGRYRIASQNPNSAFHVSLELDYPNELDRARAASDGRRKLGGQIFIHGKAASIGCLAMGDEAAEDLFVLVARVGREHVVVVIAPHDFRGRPPPTRPPGAPAWCDELYGELARELNPFHVTR